MAWLFPVLPWWWMSRHGCAGRQTGCLCDGGGGVGFAASSLVFQNECSTWPKFYIRGVKYKCKNIYMYKGHNLFLACYIYLYPLFSRFKSRAIFYFWSFDGSVSQSNPVYANLPGQALANQTACMLGEPYRRSFPHVPKNGGQNHCSGRESPGVVWPVPVHLPGYKPEEPGIMEGGGRDSVWGVYIQCT